MIARLFNGDMLMALAGQRGILYREHARLLVSSSTATYLVQGEATKH